MKSLIPFLFILSPFIPGKSTYCDFQAGHFKVPQSRRRLVIIAAAPGQSLPRIPKPITFFNESRTSVRIGNETIWISAPENSPWSRSAPFRAISIRDAISDLPQIQNGDQACLEQSWVFRSIMPLEVSGSITSLPFSFPTPFLYQDNALKIILDECYINIFLS